MRIRYHAIMAILSTAVRNNPRSLICGESVAGRGETIFRSAAGVYAGPVDLSWVVAQLLGENFRGGV